MHQVIQTSLRTALVTALLPVLLGVVGCSGGETISNAPPRAEVVKKRDEMQKATQSGKPGSKAAAVPGHRGG